ncbi:MAG: PIN domain-containing protein [Candidatus Nanohaloarchaea archaeon]
MDKKILLDTNFLVAPFQLSVSVFEELDRLYPYNELYTLDDALQEAKSIESGKYGELVEKLLESEEIEVLETEGDGTVDDLIVDLADDFIVATNDKELKQRLLDKNAEIVIVRSQNYLEALNRKEYEQ